MTSPAFDTLKFIQTLVKAGIPDHHAQAITKAQNEAFTEMSTSALATKNDFTSLQGEISHLAVQIDKLDTKIDRAESELSGKIDKLDIELNAKIDKVEVSLNAKIDRVKSELKSEIKNLDTKFTGKFNLLYWMGSLLLASNVSVFFKLFSFHG